MATFLGLGTSVLFGNTVRASTEVLTDFIAPLEPNDTVTITGNLVVEGSISNDDIRLTATETNIGVNVGQSTAGQDNTFVGSSSGNAITSGVNNTFLGTRSGVAITTGVDNTFIGTDAGTATTIGENNTFVGNESGEFNVDGNNNTFIGEGAGNRNSDGDNNVYLGNRAGFLNLTGSDNTFLGYRAGQSSSASGCVLIGHDAGLINFASNRLMIDNTSTNAPLIDGNFSSRNVILNGDVQLGTIGGSDVVDFRTTVAGAAGASAGYITVKVNGIDKKIEFFDV